MSKNILFPFSFLSAICLGIFSSPVMAQVPAKIIDPALKYVTKNAEIFTTVLEPSIEKSLLRTQFAYKMEYIKAAELYGELRTLSLSPLALDMQRWSTRIENTVVNKTLKKSLLKDLSTNNYSSMLNKIEAYYHLTPEFLPLPETTLLPPDEAAWFSKSALFYIQHNPHKPSLRLREILKHPNVAKEIKIRLKEFLNMTGVPVSLEQEFLRVAEAGFRQYKTALELSQASESVTQTIQLYKDFLSDMKEFVAKYNRTPSFTGDLPGERALFNRALPLLASSEINQFEEMLPILKEIFTFMEMYPSKRYDRAYALTELSKFFKEKGFLPRPVATRGVLGDTYIEASLYETLRYWEIHDLDFRVDLGKIIYPPKEDFPIFW